MFNVEIKTEVLKNILLVIGSITDEVKLNITEDQVNILTVDPAHVAMLKMTLKAAVFETYKADESVMGIDITKIQDLLKLAKPTDQITIEHDEKNNKLIFKLANLTRHMAVLDTSGMIEPKVPDMTLPTKVSVSTGELMRGVKASEYISDQIELSAAPDEFKLSAEGDTDSVDLLLTKDALEKLDCKEPVKSRFSLEYLSAMIKSAGSIETIELQLGSNYPAKIEFPLADGNCQVSYLLAPRIESE